MVGTIFDINSFEFIIIFNTLYKGFTKDTCE